MKITCSRAAIVMFAVCVGAGPASAVFFPAVQRPTKSEFEAQQTRGYLTMLKEDGRDILIRQFRQVVGSLALSADYHYGTQDLVGNSFGFAFEGDTELNTYTLRPELVWTNWLSTYAIVGFHRGTNRASVPALSTTTTLDLDGWAAGMGVTAALGLPGYYWSEDVIIDPLFIVPDFNWTHNEFDDVLNTVNVYNVTTRIGWAVTANWLYWGLYGGPQYQTSTKGLVVPFNSMEVPVDAEPKEAWSGVIGSFFGLVAEEDPDQVQNTPKTLRTERARPYLMLTVEGGVGNRQGVLVSLRYEHNFLQYLTD